MKKEIENIDIDQLIGSMNQNVISKDEQVLVREYRLKLWFYMILCG